MAPTLQKLVIQQNFQLPSSPKSGSLVLLVSMEMEKFVSHYEKMALILQKLVIQQNFQFQLPTPPPKSSKNHQTPTQISTPLLSKPNCSAPPPNYQNSLLCPFPLIEPYCYTLSHHLHPLAINYKYHMLCF